MLLLGEMKIWVGENGAPIGRIVLRDEVRTEAGRRVHELAGLERAVVAVEIARRTLRVATQSIWLGRTLSVLLMLVAVWGIIPAIIGAALQELVDVVTILNSLRAHGDPARPGRRSSDSQRTAPTPDERSRRDVRHSPVAGARPKL